MFVTLKCDDNKGKVNNVSVLEWENQVSPRYCDYIFVLASAWWCLIFCLIVPTSWIMGYNCGWLQFYSLDMI